MEEAVQGGHRRPRRLASDGMAYGRIQGRDVQRTRCAVLCPVHPVSLRVSTPQPRAMGIDLNVHTVSREHEHPEQLKKGDAGDATSDAHGLRDDRIHIRAGVSVPAQSQKPPAPHQGGQLAPPQPRGAKIRSSQDRGVEDLCCAPGSEVGDHIPEDARRDTAGRGVRPDVECPLRIARRWRRNGGRARRSQFRSIRPPSDLSARAAR